MSPLATSACVSNRQSRDFAFSAHNINNRPPAQHTATDTLLLHLEERQRGQAGFDVFHTTRAETGGI